MDTPAGHYSVFRVPFQIDADGDCTRCGLKIEPDEDTLEPHECPPGFTDPAMSWSKGLKRYNGVEQDDEGAYVYYDEHIAALRRAKAEGRQEGKEYAWNEAAMRAGCAAHRACCGIEADNSQGKIHGCCVVCGVPWPCETAQFFLFKADARAAQIEEGE